MDLEERKRLTDQIISTCNYLADVLAKLPGIYSRTASYFYCFKADKHTVDGSQEITGFSVYKWRANEWFCDDHYLIFKVEMAFYLDNHDFKTPFQPVRYRNLEIFKQYPMDDSDLEYAENMMAELGFIATHVGGGLIPVYRVSK